MAYAAASDVAAFCPNLLTGASNFSATTLPTLAQINVWLSSGCGQIDNRLKARNYTPPSASGGSVWDELSLLNTYYGVSKAELARTNVRLSVTERSRAQVFQKLFDDGMAELLTNDLTLAGLTSGCGGYMGGVSQAEKDAVNSNSDRVPSRFTRGQFSYPGTSVSTSGSSR